MEKQLASLNIILKSREPFFNALVGKIQKALRLE
jgi:hypothetical protein